MAKKQPSSNRYLELLGGYEAVKKCLAQGPEWIVEEMKASGLRGRGGAGFSAGMKWSFVPKQSAKPKFILVNGDESETGTCKDHLIFLHDPHSVIEGTIIAGLAVGAKMGFIYLRGEYRYLLEIMERAVADACGTDLLAWVSSLGLTDRMMMLVAPSAGCAPGRRGWTPRRRRASRSPPPRRRRSEHRQARAELVQQQALHPEFQTAPDASHGCGSLAKSRRQERRQVAASVASEPRSIVGRRSRRCAACGARAVVDDQAVAHPDDPLGVLGDVVFVGDHDDGLARVVEPAEHLHDLVAGLGVEVARRLVGEDDVRVVDQRAGDRDALLLAAGELGRAVVEPVCQADHAGPAPGALLQWPR